MPEFHGPRPHSHGYSRSITPTSMPSESSGADDMDSHASQGIGAGVRHHGRHMVSSLINQRLPGRATLSPPATFVGGSGHQSVEAQIGRHDARFADSSPTARLDFAGPHVGAGSQRLSSSPVSRAIQPTQPGVVFEVTSNPRPAVGREANRTTPVSEQTCKADETAESNPPAWSELKTKAGKERKRLPLACIACRRKKIRCSGEKPACKHCLRSRIPCVYKITTRKAAPRTDYMAMLDKRLKRMEERVIKMIPKDEQHLVSITGRSVVKPPASGAPSKVGNANKKRAADQAFGSELDDWASAEPLELRRRETRKSNADELQNNGDSDEHTLLNEGADKLPSRELQAHLIEVFFDYVYGQSYPLLHKPSFLRKFAQDAVPPVLMLAVCAVSARFSVHPSVRSEPAFLRGEDWASAARDISLRRYDRPNITILIVYLILGLHEFGTCQGGRSWMFGGMAQRMAYALQLHKDLDHDPRRRSSDPVSQLTPTDREIRRRTMWSCFLMDRFNSSGTDRPLFANVRDIRAQLPICESFFQLEITGSTEDLDGRVPNPILPDTGQVADPKSNMGVMAYLIRLVAIWGKLIEYLNLGGKDRDTFPVWSDKSEFQHIRKTLEEWDRTLPSALRYTEENLHHHASEKIASQFLFMHVVHNQTLLFMYNFALPGSEHALNGALANMPSEFQEHAYYAARNAANRVSQVLSEATNHLVVAPFAGYSAFFSSITHIQGAFSGDAELEHSSKNNLAINLKYLARVKRYWGMFHYIIENLRDYYRRRANTSRSNSTTGKQSTAGIFQYGDWFDRYPHGLQDTGSKSPKSRTQRERGSDGVLGQKGDLQTVEEFFAEMSPPNRSAPIPLQHAKKIAKKTLSPLHEQQKRPLQQAQGAQILSPNAREQERISPDEVAYASHPHPHPASPSLQHHPLNMSQEPQQLPPSMPNFPVPHPHASHLHGSHLANPPPPQFFPSLDRQMVLESYAGYDPRASNLALQHHLPNLTDPMLSPPQPITGHTSSYEQYIPPYVNDPHPTATAPIPHPGALNPSSHPPDPTSTYWNTPPSTAWFMPFNMEPPNTDAAASDLANDMRLDAAAMYPGGPPGPFDWIPEYARFAPTAPNTSAAASMPEMDAMGIPRSM